MEKKFKIGTVKCVNAVHSSSLPGRGYGTNAMGYVVSNFNQAFYYAGDTALTLDMQLIPEYKKIDIAILPIGDNFTMGLDDAVKAAKLIKTIHVIEVHYDTFEAIKINKQNTLTAFAKEGIKLHLPRIGKSIVI